MFKAEYFFARILLPFLAGIMLVYFFAFKYLLFLSGILCLATIFLLLIVNLLYEKYNLYNYKGIIGALILFFFFCFGSFICLLNKDNLYANYYGNKQFTHLKVWVATEPQQNGKTLKFIAKTIKGYSRKGKTKVKRKFNAIC